MSEKNECKEVKLNVVLLLDGRCTCKPFITNGGFIKELDKKYKKQTQV